MVRWTNLDTSPQCAAGFRSSGYDRSKRLTPIHCAGRVGEYLKTDLDLDAIAVLTDGIDRELWVRPQKEPLGNEYEPKRTASLHSALNNPKTQNMEIESYSPRNVRNRIDTRDFNEFTAQAVITLIQDEFGIAADIDAV